MNTPTPINIIGTMVRIVRTDSANQTLYFRVPDGRIGRASGLLNLDTVSAGDTIAISDSGWEQVPSRMWIEQNSIGT